MPPVAWQATDEAIKDMELQSLLLQIEDQRIIQRVKEAVRLTNVITSLFDDQMTKNCKVYSITPMVQMKMKQLLRVMIELSNIVNSTSRIYSKVIKALNMLAVQLKQESIKSNIIEQKVATQRAQSQRSGSRKPPSKPKSVKDIEFDYQERINMQSKMQLEKMSKVMDKMQQKYVENLTKIVDENEFSKTKSQEKEMLLQQFERKLSDMEQRKRDAELERQDALIKLNNQLLRKEQEITKVNYINQQLISSQADSLRQPQYVNSQYSFPTETTYGTKAKVQYEGEQPQLTVQNIQPRADDIMFNGEVNNLRNRLSSLLQNTNLEMHNGPEVALLELESVLQSFQKQITSFVNFREESYKTELQKCGQKIQDQALEVSKLSNALHYQQLENERLKNENQTIGQKISAMDGELFKLRLNNQVSQVTGLSPNSFISASKV